MGWDEHDERQAREIQAIVDAEVAAAVLAEREAREKKHKAACKARKWTLIAPDGRVWQNENPMLISVALLAELGGYMQPLGGDFARILNENRWALYGDTEAPPTNKMRSIMESLTKAEQKTLELARKAVRYLNNGNPMKDAIDDDEVADALELLIKLADKIDTPT